MYLFRRLPFLLVFASILACSGSSHAQISKEEDTEAEIEALRLQISEIQTGILQKQTDKDKLQARLADAEKSIGELEQRLRNIEQEIAA